jgi:trehalose/maltose hydrolase-like predicted phosphorylase
VSERRFDEAFALAYESFEPGEEGLREALTSTGNGYFCTRGAAEWEDAGGLHYPGTYAHGGYNRETTVMGGRPVLNEDLVNLPNWLVLKLRIEGDDAIGLDNVELLEYRHEYDIRYALLSRTLRFRDRARRETSVRSRRFVSMAHHHQAAIEWVITPENWSGRIEVVTAIDGRVTNRGVARYAELEGRHLDPVSPRTFGPEVIALKVQTRQSNLYVAQAARTTVFRGDEPVDVHRSLFQTEDYIQQVVACDARAGDPVRVEKTGTGSRSTASWARMRSTASWARMSSTRSIQTRPRAGCATTPTRTSWWRGSPRRLARCSTCCPRVAARRSPRASASPTRRSTAGMR